MSELSERLKVPVPHYECEDSWYSCPLSGNCLNDLAGDDCDCPSGKINAERAEVARVIERQERQIDMLLRLSSADPKETVE